EGACCPTQQGVYLGCCGSVKVDGGIDDDDDDDEEEEGPGDDRDCANHPGCSALQGACCPSPDGTMLSCCSDRL
ncbi:unnamed protein product, partial [Ectocarpus sp. 8 AP-2014]